ncbi:VOC family protein [Nibrella saemangeumensis]|uniref:VOC family protein n=1 Tax=Nibrella saemangeumensis TaxID=1084526 RepID=A0ABP8N601_9BACT
MRIDHLAIWVRDLEGMRTFYETYFGARSNERYYNPKKDFYSYFLSFDGEETVRLELMTMSGIPPTKDDALAQFSGLIHFAISVGSETTVDTLTERLRADGYTVVGEPRWTGDGYYESVVLDPERNRIEITL